MLDFGAVHDTAQGAFQATGNPLDVMIDGPGYLNVEAPGGGVAYTRAGFVKILQTGDLATSGGERLLDTNGRPINVPQDQMRTLTIAADGTVMTPNGPLGRLAITSFPDEMQVTAARRRHVRRQSAASSPSRRRGCAPAGSRRSNVEPIVETTKMVEILRAYQSSMAMSSRHGRSAQ